MRYLEFIFYLIVNRYIANSKPRFDETSMAGISGYLDY